MEKVKRIASIKIENVKGISSKAFSLDLIPNKPSLLVAPNGFGKSSFATAFGSLKSNRIEIHKDHFHKENEELRPVVEIEGEYENQTSFQLKADSSTNTISPIFDVFVINSQLFPKARKLKVNGNTIVTSSIEIKPIVIVNKIPIKVSFQSTFTGRKSSFGKNGKILPNIDAILTNAKCMVELFESVEFGKLSQIRFKNIESAFRDCINSKEGSANKIKEEFDPRNYSELESTLQYNKAIEVISKHSEQSLSKLDTILSIYQVFEIFRTEEAVFKKFIKYNKYLLDKFEFEGRLSVAKETWKNIKPREDKDDGLIIEFPKANQISNGERDTLSFLSMLIQARLKLRSENCILIIDEVFDYLDDANLISAQYYVTEMISELKSEGRKLFPLIMTHLNPGYFKTFCFKDQKVYYLDKIRLTTSRIIENLILKRDAPAIKDSVSKYYFHFCPGSISLEAEFSSLGIDQSIDTFEKFETVINGHLENYLQDRNFDPLGVCCAIRIKIEKWIFSALDSCHHQNMVETFKTSAKLELSESLGLDCPDVFYMLGIIYNEALHLKPNQDYAPPIFSKLKNLTVKNMIRKTVEKCT